MKDGKIDKYWLEYIDYWRDEIADENNPPTEAGFWYWYAMNIRAGESNGISNAE